MKKIFFALMISPTLSVAEVTITPETCHDLAVEVSIEAFSPDQKNILYAPYKLNDKIGVQYIQTVRRQLLADLEEFCKNSEGENFEKFKSLFHGRCSTLCQKHKTLFSGNQQVTADTVCLTICNETYRKLLMFSKGYRAAKGK